MRVPEYANPIRVRWYFTPAEQPGIYGPSIYTSSDWDETPDQAPPLGEDGVARNPNLDWRNGAPPPWSGACACADFPGGLPFAFQVSAKNTADLVCNCTPIRTPALCYYVGSCEWESAAFPFCGLHGGASWDFVGTAARQQAVLEDVNGHSIATWTRIGPWNGSDPLLLPLDGTPLNYCLFPPTVLVQSAPS